MDPHDRFLTYLLSSALPFTLYLEWCRWDTDAHIRKVLPAGLWFSPMIQMWGSLDCSEGKGPQLPHKRHWFQLLEIASLFFGRDPNRRWATACRLASIVSFSSFPASFPLIKSTPRYSNISIWGDDLPPTHTDTGRFSHFKKFSSDQSSCDWEPQSSRLVCLTCCRAGAPKQDVRYELTADGCQLDDRHQSD